MKQLFVLLISILLSFPSTVFSQYKGNFDKKSALKKLSPLQYRVTQLNATEPAFNNRYWNNKKAGIYVDIVSGQPLFSSTHKYDSKTGWPSFTQPIDDKSLKFTKEWGLFTGYRMELKSTLAGSHLGHVFNDGPAPYHKRYCINSASLAFIPKSKMQQLGYGRYLYLFESSKP